jgi:hypothetical protein
VVDRAGLAVARGVQDQLERRVIYGEVGVPGPQLGRGRAEHRGVERDRGVQMADVDRQLHAGYQLTSGVSVAGAGQVYPQTISVTEGEHLPGGRRGHFGAYRRIFAEPMLGI